MKNTKISKLVTSAMLVAVGMAISVICEYIPFLNLPFGGKITIGSALPVIIVSYMYGIKWGLGSGFVFALLRMAVGASTVAALFTPSSDSFMGIRTAFLVVLLDYICAFTFLGLGGIYRNKMKKTPALVLGSVSVLLIRFLFHFVSGTVFYGAWAEWFFTETAFADLSISAVILEKFSSTGLSAIYSFVYTSCYMIPEIIITAVLAASVSSSKLVEKNI